MKKLLPILLLIPLVSFGQLEIEKPEGWFLQGKNEAVYNNLKKIYSKNKPLAKELIDDIEKRGTVLYAYSKYDLKTHKGLSPTINVAIGRHNKLDLEGLKKHTKEKLTKDLKKATINFSFKYIKDIKIKNNNAFVMHSTFNLPNYKGNVRSWSYMYINEDNLFYQISFSDLESDKCDDLFKEIINSIKE